MTLGFTALLLSLLVLPGLALSLSLKATENRFLISVGFSYALFAVLLVISQYTKLSQTFFIYLLFIYLLTSCVIILIQWRTPYISWKLNWKADWGAISIIILMALYHHLVMPYIEIPADIYTHIERFQTALAWQQQDKFGTKALSLTKLFMQKGYIWYHLIALTADLTDTAVDSVIYISTLITKTLFVLSIYFFAQTVFAKQANKQLIALLTCLFVVLHMGINVFAYIRYYSFAPSMLNFVLYFSAIAIFLNGLNTIWHWHNLARLIFIGILTLAASSIHTQEALFIVVMCFLLLTTKAFQQTSSVFREGVFRGTVFRGQAHKQSITLWSLTTIGIIGFIGAYIFAHEHLNRAPNVQWRLWEFGGGEGLWPALTVLNLKYQFIRVITIWGCVVYLLFFLHWRRYQSNPFIIAGMLSPMFTILNPFFVDLFLRMDNSTTLWRLCYLVPIHFVAGDLFLYYAKRLITYKSWPQTGIAMGIIGLLIALLLPIKNTWQQTHYSRFPTLGKVADTHSYHHMNDLMGYLNSLEKKYLILTDPITGYVVSAMTKHHSYRRKFHRIRYLNFTFDDYNDDPLAKYRDYLLIVNLRTQGHSNVGALAKHWSPDIMNNIQSYYPPQLLSYIQDTPERFKALWSNDNMAIYLIQ